MSDKYRHFKGAFYWVICIATHSETSEKLVIYKNDKDEVYARPYNMFFETVEHNGENVPRFEKVD